MSRRRELAYGGEQVANNPAALRRGRGKHIVQKIVAELSGRHGDMRVAGVALGISYTAVLLESGHAGVAYSFARHATDRTLEGFSLAGTLVGSPARKLLELWTIDDPVLSSISIAAANALISASSKSPVVKRAKLRDSGGRGAKNPLRAIDKLLDEIKGDDVVGMVGYFKPIVDAILTRAKTLNVFELKQVDEFHVLPSSRIPEIMPSSTVALISGTTLVNGTIDDILRHSAAARIVAVIGPTTVLLPAAYEGTRVNRLGGAFITDGPAALRIVMEGGGVKELKRISERIELIL
jgi:uncharacterized protein